MNGSTPGEAPGFEVHWPRVILVLGAVLVAGALAKAGTAILGNAGYLEAGLDLLLLSVPGFVMLYAGLWLPRSSIDTRFYRRIVGWMAGGIVVMGIVLALRVVHPGVSVQFTFGTQAVLLSIGSIAGLGIGVNKAQALTHAKTLEVQNETLSATERELEDAIEQLEDSNERLEQFAYAASHDLQEPLRMVTSYLQLIEQRHGEEFDEECQEFLDFAVDGAERMRGMIQGLLEYSRVETQGGSFDAVALDDVLDDVLTDLQFRIGETEATITRDELPTVTGDGRQIKQVFQNLISNAIEYSGDDPPEIHVAATREGEEWAIAVHDEGIGIEDDDTGRIFDVFQRLHSIEDQAGSGIGLALTKRIVERHGGNIWVESVPGDGSTFWFTLPARDTSGSESAAKSAGKSADTSAGESAGDTAAESAGNSTAESTDEAVDDRSKTTVDTDHAPEVGSDAVSPGVERE